jgi:ABC-2 type transport system permease protein
MRRIGLLAWNDLRLTLRDRAAFIWLLAMPIAMMWLFGGAGGAPSGPPQISLSLVNHDSGWLSRALIDELTDEQVVFDEIDPATVDGDEDRVRTLVIPDGFTEGVLAGRQQVLRLLKEPGSNESFGIAAEVHVIRAIVRTVSRLIEMGAAGDTSGESSAPELFRELGMRAERVTLEVQTAGRGRPVPRGVAQSVPGNLTFVVMMMTLIYGGVFLVLEKQSGMLLRQSVLPMSRRQLVLGKVLGRLLIAGIQLTALTLAGRFVFGIDWGRSPLGLLLVLASYSVAVAGLSTLLGAVSRTPGQASAIGWILAMILAALGGCWWPSEVMPDWMQKAAHLLPTAWAMDAFHALITFGHGLEAVVLPALVLFGFGIVFILVGARLLRFDSG